MPYWHFSIWNRWLWWYKLNACECVACLSCFLSSLTLVALSILLHLILSCIALNILAITWLICCCFCSFWHYSILSSGQQSQNPLLLLGQYSDDEVDEGLSKGPTDAEVHSPMLNGEVLYYLGFWCYSDVWFCLKNIIIEFKLVFMIIISLFNSRIGGEGVVAKLSSLS